MGVQAVCDRAAIRRNRFIFNCCQIQAAISKRPCPIWLDRAHRRAPVELIRRRYLLRRQFRLDSSRLWRPYHIMCHLSLRHHRRHSPRRAYPPSPRCWATSCRNTSHWPMAAAVLLLARNRTTPKPAPSSSPTRCSMPASVPSRVGLPSWRCVASRRVRRVVVGSSSNCPKKMKMWICSDRGDWPSVSLPRME